MLNLLFIRHLQHIGLALATGIAAWFQAGLLVYILYRKNMVSFSKLFFKDLIYVVLAIVAMAVVLLKSISIYGNSTNTFFSEAIYVIGLVTIGIVVYSLIYKACLLLDQYCCCKNTCKQSNIN
jgi:putative peptidoglycan lipid II flippase